MQALRALAPPVKVQLQPVWNGDDSRAADSDCPARKIMNVSSAALGCALAFTLSACSLNDDVEVAAGPHYGAEISASAPLTLVELLDDASTHDGNSVLVQGQVLEVCQSKGCWMVLSAGDRTMRVRFEDYAFFVPKDLAGSTIVVEGVFSIQTVPVDEARHYLEDAGRMDEAAAITEPQEGFGFMAAGVRVL
ncbi:MAG: hypothetical protein ACI9EF_002217 [Pseudohongiellaceae bacterium]